MRYNINLDVFKKTTLSDGSALLDRGDTVRVISDRILPDGKQQVKTKIIDMVNYVDKITLVLSYDGTEILSAQCTCGACHDSVLCAHAAAVVLKLNNTDRSVLTNLISASSVSEGVKPEKVAESPANTLYARPFEVPAVPEEPQLPLEPEKPTIPQAPEVPEEPGVSEASEIPIEPEQPEEPEAQEPQWDGQYHEMKILFGHDTESGEAIYWQPNHTERVFHTNTGVIGTMGTGKTQFTKSLVTQIYREQAAQNNFDGAPVSILIFDYKGDYNESKKDFVDAVKAKVYKPYRLGYNPFSLIQGTVFRPLLPVHTANTFKDTLSKSFGLGAKQQHLLLDCILEAYEQQGIVPHDPSTWNRPAPTFAQVYEVFLKKAEGKPQDSLFAAMYKLHTFCIFEPNPWKAVSLYEMVRGVTVLDLSGHDPDIQKFVIAITLDQFYAQMLPIGSSKTNGKLRQLRTLILVDEADNFMREDFPALRKIMKEGREFGVGVILSTQSLKHFAGGEDDYSRYVLTWVVHNVSDLSKREIEYIFKLQEKGREISEIYGRIKDLVKHESIVKISGSEILKMHDRAFYQLLSENT